jgi:hypothetical protein
MDRLAVLNVVGVAAIGVLALTSLGLGAYGVGHGSAYPIPLWPQWQQLGHTAAEQWQAMAQVMPVIIACYVAHQVRSSFLLQAVDLSVNGMLWSGLQLQILQRPCCECKHGVLPGGGGGGVLNAPRNMDQVMLVTIACWCPLH